MKPIPQSAPIVATDHAKLVQAHAEERARGRAREAPSRADWLVAILREDCPTVATYLIARLCKNRAALMAAVESLDRRQEPSAVEPAPNFMFEVAGCVAAELHHSYIGPEHILLALTRESTAFGDTVRSAELTWTAVLTAFRAIDWAIPRTQDR